MYIPTMKWPSLPSFLATSSAGIPQDCPLSELPPHELEAMDMLRAQAIPMLNSPPEPLPETDPWSSMHHPHMTTARDEMLLRFLRFNTLNVDKALKQLRNVLIWRSKSRVAELGTHAFQGDRVGIPVVRIGDVTDEGDGLFFSPAESYDKKSVDHKAQEIGVGAMFEHMLYAGDGPGMRRGTVVIDFRGFSVRNVDLIGLRNGILVYTSYYPDVFNRVLLIHYPKFLYGVWKAIAPLLDARTVSRVIWLSNGEELRQELEGIFPKEKVPRWLGGDLTQSKITLLSGTQIEPRDVHIS